MTKNSLKLLIVSVLTTLGAVAFAGPVISGGGIGDTANYISCDNPNSSFVIRGTAVPTFKQGLLQSTDDVKPTKLSCRPDNSFVAENQPSSGQVLWSCREYPFHDGNILVKVEVSGMTGVASAYVSQMQEFPVQPKQIATLNCTR